MENRQQTHLHNLVSHTHNNAPKMVQVTAGAGVYKRMEGKEKRLSDLQKRINDLPRTRSAHLSLIGEILTTSRKKANLDAL